jgi:hypothetical protein
MEADFIHFRFETLVVLPRSGLGRYSNFLQFLVVIINQLKNLRIQFVIILQFKKIAFTASLFMPLQ